MEKIIEKAKAEGWKLRRKNGELRITFPDKETMRLRRAGARLTCTASESILDFLKTNYSLCLIQSGGISADSSDIVSFLDEIATKFTQTAREELKAFRENLEGLGETEARAETTVRLGQNALRKLLLTERRACEISGVVLGELLVASHIVPWAECKSARDRLDLENVLLLAKNWDALFDAHLISFDSRTGALVKSKRLSDEDFRALTGREATDATIRISVKTDARRAYLDKHLDALRQKDAEEA